MTRRSAMRHAHPTDPSKQNELEQEHAEQLQAKTDQIQAQSELLQDQAQTLQQGARTRVAHERALATGGVTLRTLIEGLDAGVMFFAEDGAVSAYNASALQILGLDRAEISARTLACWDAVREDGSAYAPGELPIAVTLDTGEPLDGAVMGIARPDGRRAWIAVNTRRVEYGPSRKIGVVASFTDVTERRAAKRALERHHDFLNALFENLSDAIVACDAKGNLTYFNNAIQSLHGLPIEPLPPEEWAAHFGLFAADGKTPLAKGEIPLLRALRGEVIKNVEMVFAPAGQTPLNMLASGTAIYDAIGEKIGAVVVMRDITDLNIAQLAVAHSSAQLRQAQKMEAVGRLAGGIAHDFNNLLTAITSYAQFVLDDTSPDDPRRNDLEEIRAAADRAAALTRQLLAFSRRRVLHVETIDPNALIANAEQLLGRLISEDVQIALRLDPAVWAINCDAGQLEQVIFNLALNARDAMPEGGGLVIETTNVELDEAAAAQQVGLAPGRYVKLTISDTGEGMDAEMQGKIFEPFFTTKDFGKGTGLGLSLVYGIVTQCGGNVAVDSEVGVGTTFRILLPAADPDRIEQPVAPPLAAPGRGTETVLIVEDDVVVRRAVGRMLALNGYTAVIAENGGDALKIVRARGRDIDMVITDMVMPGISGRELIERIRSSNPEIRVMIMSGYTPEPIGPHGAPLPGIAFLEKPFTAQQLIARMREVLDGSSRSMPRDFLSGQSP